MSFPGKSTQHSATPTTVEEAHFWWFLECDEFDWYIVNGDSTEQVLWIHHCHRNNEYELTVWNGNCIRTHAYKNIAQIWKVNDIG